MFSSPLIKLFIWVSILGGISFFLIYNTADQTLQQQVQLRQNRADLEALQQSVDNINNSITAFKRLEQERADARETNPNEITRLDIVNYALPEHEDQVDVYNIAVQLASESGLVDIPPPTPQPAPSGEAESDIHTIKFTISGQGTYEQALALVKRLEHHSRVFHINAVNFEASPASGDPEQTVVEGLLTVEISATAYYYSKQTIEQEI